MSEELIQKLTQRIQILVNEVETLTAIIDSTVIDQQDTVLKYRLLQEQAHQHEEQLHEANQKLQQAFRHNVKEHLDYIHQGKQHIDELLSIQQQDYQGGPSHPLYILCTEKANEVNDLRQKLQQMEQQNIQLYSENVRLKTYVQHEKIYRQLELINGNYQVKTVQPNEQVDVPSLNLQRDPKFIQQYMREPLNTREPLQDKNSIEFFHQKTTRKTD